MSVPILCEERRSQRTGQLSPRAFACCGVCVFGRRLPQNIPFISYRAVEMMSGAIMKVEAEAPAEWLLTFDMSTLLS